MALRIPVNPQTSPASEVVPYNPASKAVDVSGFAKGLESLGNSLDQLHAKQVEAQKQSDAFDLNTKFLSTINDREQDFQARKTDPNLNVNGFVGQVNQDYTKQDQDLIAQAQAAGYDKNAVREFALKLGTSTNSFLGQSITFQHQSQRANASTNVDGLIDQGSRYVVQNPNDIEGTLGEINHTIDLNPFLTPDERAIKKDEAQKQLTGTAITSLTKQNPELIMSTIGKEFADKASAAAQVAGGQSANPWANVAVNVAQHFGLDPAELGGIMSFESGLNPQATNASGHLGLIQFGKAEQQKYNVNAQSSPADWTKAITSFFQDRGLKKGANIMDVYSTILTGHPGNYDAADSNGTTVRNAVPRILQDHVPKAQAWIGQLAPPVDNNFHPPEGQTSYKALTPPMQQVDPDTGQPLDQYSAYPQVVNPDTSQWDKRADGSNKGMGWLGLRQRPDGKVSSEISVGVEINGKEQEIPLMVPGLTKPEMDYLMTHNPDQEVNPSFIKDMPKTILTKAEAFAKSRIDQGQSPFRGPNEPSPALPSVSGPQNLAPQGNPLNPEPVKTGIPAIDHASGPQQLQAIAEAQSMLREKNSQDKALADTQVDNAIAAMKQGLPPGYVPSQEELQRLHGNVQGANIQGQLDAYKTAQPIIAGMKTANSTVLQQQVTALKPLNPNDPDFAKKQAVWQAVNEAAVENLRQRQEDPAAYLMQAFPNITKQLAGAKTDNDWRAAYKAQANAYQHLGIPPSDWLPVPKDQMAKIANDYKGMNPPQKLQWLEHQYATLTNTGMYVPFMSQLNDRGSGPGYDGWMMSQLKGHPEYNAIMDDVLHGQQVIAEDPARKPNYEIINKSFAGATNGIGPAINGLNPTASRIYNDEAAAIYVANGGTVGQRANGFLDDPTLYQESLRRAMGGLKGNSDTGFYTMHRGSPATILPSAVTGKQFDNWVDQLTPGQLSAASGGTGAYNKFRNPVLIKDIQNYGTFVARAPAASGHGAMQYAIRMQDGNTLMNNRGGEYRITITPHMVLGK